MRLSQAATIKIKRTQGSHNGCITYVNLTVPILICLPLRMALLSKHVWGIYDVTHCI
jgi:hypothetical protein